MKKKQIEIEGNKNENCTGSDQCQVYSCQLGDLQSQAFSDEYKEQIQIKEYTINQYTEDILADLYKEQADMVAFSCYIWNMGMVEELAELLHQLRPEMPVWFGGPEVSYDAAECLQRNHGVTGSFAVREKKVSMS